MRKNIVIGAVLALTSVSAFASQARLQALGMKETDNEGMYHIQDRRNIFLNPAWLNIYNNYVTVEYGEQGYRVEDKLPAPASASMDMDQMPKAQGGFFKKHGAMTYGLYLGAESNTSSLLRFAGTAREALSTGKTLHSADNQFDLFLAGDQGIKWGGNVTFARGKDESRSASDLAMATRWGVMADRWDAHLNLSLASKAHATDATSTAGVKVYHELKGKLGLQLGGSYLVSGNNRVFGYVKHYSWEQSKKLSVAPTSTDWKGDFTSLYLGWGSHIDVNSTDRIYFSLAGKKTDINAKFASKGEIRHLVVPASIAFESKTNEWLTLRGSVSQAIWSHRDNKNFSVLNPVAQGIISNQFGSEGKGTVTHTTEVRGGATLTFGNLEFDGLLGLAAVDGDGAGEINSDNIFSRVAMTYNF